ncbi:hypothetical protein VIBNIAM115_710038 [Vibrio nigripulchritudo AM115]|nr:hypothetical protein VIBNIAM115_710038 [Vibrio nigripulchritudo AM115]
MTSPFLLFDVLDLHAPLFDQHFRFKPDAVMSVTFICKAVTNVC